MDGIFGLAAFGFWMFIGAAAVAGIWDGVRKRDAEHETLRRMIESGREFDADTLDRLMSLSQDRDRQPDRDFRIAALWVIPAAPGLLLLGLILGAAVPAQAGLVQGARGTRRTAAGGAHDDDGVFFRQSLRLLFNDAACTEIYTLYLHDALPI